MKNVWDVALEVTGMAEDEADKHIENFIKEDDSEFVKRSDYLMSGSFRIGFKTAINIMAKKISEG